MRRCRWTSVWVEVTCALRGRRARRAARRGLIRDVSERKRLDDQSRDLYQQLLQAEKMAALARPSRGSRTSSTTRSRRFSAGRSALSEKGLDAPTRRGIDVSSVKPNAAARHRTHLLTSRASANETRAMIDLNQLVSETLALRAYENSHEHTVTTELADGLPRSLPTHTRFSSPAQPRHQRTARDARGHGRGRWSFGTWHTRRTMPQRSRCATTALAFRSRCGRRSSIRFLRPRSRQGHRLGLTSRMRSSRNRRHIRVESQPGHGASFVVGLPGERGGVRRRSRCGRRPPSMEAVRGASVLLVETNGAGRRVSEALRDAGFGGCTRRR